MIAERMAVRVADDAADFDRVLDGLAELLVGIALQPEPVRPARGRTRAADQPHTVGSCRT